ncbi:MAG: hypothetical protein KC493_05795 [Bacteriovoracaceae bacterium]|nr:hypothetical protein [Bacteriovoracaceae bacterium]
MKNTYLKILTVLVVQIFFSKAFGMVDQKATLETKTLYQKLSQVSGKGLLFGHQNAEKEGHGWLRDGTPDVYRVSSKYPAIVGFDFKDVLQYYNVYFDFYLKKVKKVHEMGGVSTFSWHTYNPVTTRNFYDKTPAIAEILPGGSRHEYFKKRLDVVAKFAKKAVDNDGKLIPIIFRPWHEHNHKWFWWGNSRLSGRKAEIEFINLWKFTVTYLRDEKGVHNFIYAYSPGRPSDNVSKHKGYFYKYPGDSWVDIFGLDDYKASTKEMISWLRFMVKESLKRGKVAALTETGIEGVKNHKYWTKDFLNPIKRDSLAKKIAYVMVWRNSKDDPNHHFAPYPGHPSVPDFLRMEEDPYSFFARDWQDFITGD